MSSRILSLLSNRSLARRALSFGRRKDGATVIEFAFLLPPFLLLMFAIIQIAVVFYASQVLETATADAARLIMTGQAQKQGLNEAEFKNSVVQPSRRALQLRDRRQDRCQEVRVGFGHGSDRAVCECQFAGTGR